MQYIIVNGSHTTSLHLDVQWLGSHIAHEDKYFKGLYVSTRCHQRTGDGDTELLVVAELTYQFVAVACGIGYLLHILVIRATKHLFGDLYNVGSMVLVEGKDERLWQVIHIRLTLGIRKQLCIDRITIGFKHQFDLGRIDDASVQFFPCIVPGLLVFDRLYFACIACFPFQLVTLADSASVFRGFCPDTIDACIHINAVNNGLLKRIVHNTVVVEEGHCLGNGRCREAYHFGCIEIFKNPSPIAINGTVALVNNDQVEEVWRQLEVISQLHFASSRILIVILILIVNNLLSCQEREQSLNGGDDNIAV